MSIFKANDIRGIYGKDLKDHHAYSLGNAFVKFTKSDIIIIGRDNRLSSPNLHKSLIRGIIEAGANVIDIGLVDSPQLYFASNHFKKPAIMITASHNPARHNGFYLCKAHGLSIYQANGLKNIENLIKSKEKIKRTRNNGKITEIDIRPLYARHILSFVNQKDIPKLKVVVDSGNGMGAQIAKELYSYFPQLEILPLFFESNGSFPNRGPDTTITKNLSKLKRKVLQTKADLGLAFDGDADRVAFVDEKGQIVEGSLIGALIADHILKKSKHQKIVYTIGCSRIVPEVIKKNHGQAIREKVGHSFVNAHMKKSNALFGIEHTGHYFYRNNFYTESPFITSLIIFSLLKNTQLSHEIKKYKKYFMTNEISFPVKNQIQVLERLKTKIKEKYNAKIETFDGLFVDLHNIWFRIRASQTENLIRFVIEGRSKEEVEDKKQELIKMINNSI